jgi:hypothetical protein
MSATIGGRWEAVFTVPSGEVIEVTTNAGTETVAIADGAYTPTSFATYFAGALDVQAPVTAGTWTVSISTGRGGTGRVTIAVTAGTYSIAWTSTLLRDLLGFAADITAQSTGTGTIVHRGIWMPNCPWTSLLSPSLAPKQTDNRSTESPTGGVVTLGGLKKYEHKSIRYSHVEIGRIREAAAVTAGDSLQRWLDDTQFNDGHVWFSRGAIVFPYWDNNGTDTLVGSDASITLGWSFSPAIEDMHSLARRISEWDGMYSVEFSRLVSEG